MKSRLKLIALIAASVLLCSNSHGSGFTPKNALVPNNGVGADDYKGELDDGTQTEARGCEDYDDPNCPTPAAADPASAEESAAPGDEADSEVEAKPEEAAEPEAEAAAEDEAEPEATGDDSDSSEPEDSSDEEDAEDPEEDEEEDEEEEDFGEDE